MQMTMLGIAAWGSMVVTAAQTGLRPSDRYREEFRQRPETARLSKEFSGDAWIVLLYAGRQGLPSVEHPQGEDVDGAMESLRSLVRTDGEWLFWFRLNNYSIAKQLSTAHQVGNGLMSIANADACRDALMLANRARVMAASMPACELGPAKAPAQTQ